MRNFKSEKIKILNSFLILTLIFLGFVFFTPNTARAVSAGQISAVPANPRPENPRTTSIFVYTAKPGDIIKDEVLLSNISPQESKVNLYATDSIPSNTGTPSCEQELDTRDEVGHWINIDNGLPFIPAESSMRAPFNIEIPKDVKSGEYNGCMILQVAEPPTTENPGISLKTRLALRVVILIPGEIHKDLEITKVTPLVENSRYLIKPELENKSNVSLDTDITVTMKSFGLFDYYSNTLKTSFLRDAKAFSIFDFKYSEWGGIFKVDVSAKYDSNPANELNGANPEYKTKTNTIWILMWPDFLHLAIMCGIFAILLIIVDRYFYKKITKK